ncbi:MAG: type VI secretion system baseplate subunit TssG [Bryobacteraceae bacterium]
MATAGRPENPALTDSPIGELLAREPYLFEFFQAVRLLERLQPGRAPVGRFVRPATEAVRFGVTTSVAFPASQIQELSSDPQPRMRVNFMGLIGPLGLLPLPYSDLVQERIRNRDYSLRDFLDIFHHRIISLFFQAWEKYRFTIAYERGERDLFSSHLRALIGIGSPGLQDRQEVPDDSLLFYAGLFALHTRSAEALRQVLADYFDAPVEVEQFVGAWYPLERGAQCSLGAGERYSEQLGLGVVVGDEVWDQQARVRVQLGPLSYQRYCEFLPGGAAHRELKAIVRFFAGNEFDVEAQLILKREDVPRCGLDGERRLGWTTWARTGAFPRNAGDTVLEISTT